LPRTPPKNRSSLPDWCRISENQFTHYYVKDR
jgi:hypothetical protein